MGKLVTTPWDPADHLATEEDRAAYLEAALEEGDPALVAAALGDIARAKGMSQVAREAGLGCCRRYKSAVIRWRGGGFDFFGPRSADGPVRGHRLGGVACCSGVWAQNGSSGSNSGGG